MRKQLCLFLLVGVTASAETFTEFYIQPTGANLNSGSTTNDAALFTYSGSFTRASGTFTNEGAGNPSVDTTNGAWVSIYTTAGATVATCVGLVTNISGQIIWISLDALGGAVANVSESIGAASCKVGGAWAGPNTNQNPSVTFPWAFMAGRMTNSPIYPPCFNFKAAIYGYTNTVTIPSSTGNKPMRISGYTTTPRDGGMATNDGSFYAGAGFDMVSVTHQNTLITDFMFCNNGASGNGYGLKLGGANQGARRVVAHDTRLSGIYGAGSSTEYVEECEAYNCNKANSASEGGISADCFVRNCVSHDNTSGANGSGFVSLGTAAYWLNCISYNNGGPGWKVFVGSTQTPLIMYNCDSYSNTLAGLDINNWTGGNPLEIINCNFLRNKGMGITNGTAGSIGALNGIIANCGFGSGTMANLVGDIHSTVTNTGIRLVSPVSYPANQTPWVAPDSGNFSVTLAQAKAAGRSLFLLYGTNSPTVSYPDISAAQASDTNSAAASGGSYTFAQ